MYVEFPSGTRCPEGYIAPCVPTGKTSGDWVQVTLTAAGYSWAQWVRRGQLLAEEDVMEG